MSSRFIRDLISFLIEIFVTSIGRLLLRDINEYDPPRILSLVIGLAFWGLVAMLLAYAVFHG